MEISYTFENKIYYSTLTFREKLFTFQILLNLQVLFVFARSSKQLASTNKNISNLQIQ